MPRQHYRRFKSQVQSCNRKHMLQLSRALQQLAYNQQQLQDLRQLQVTLMQLRAQCWPPLLQPKQRPKQAVMGRLHLQVLGTKKGEQRLVVLQLVQRWVCRWVSVGLM